MKRDPYAKSLADRKFQQRIVPVKRQQLREQVEEKEWQEEREEDE